VPELQEFWHGELRTSPENNPREIADFLAEGLSRAPSSLERTRIRIRIRMDARFYSDPVLRVLESRKCSYVVAAPDSAELRAEAGARQLRGARGVRGARARPAARRRGEPPARARLGGPRDVPAPLPPVCRLAAVVSPGYQVIQEPGRRIQFPGSCRLRMRHGF